MANNMSFYRAPAMAPEFRYEAPVMPPKLPYEAPVMAPRNTNYKGRMHGISKNAAATARKRENIFRRRGRVSGYPNRYKSSLIRIANENGRRLNYPEYFGSEEHSANGQIRRYNVSGKMTQGNEWLGSNGNNRNNATWNGTYNNAGNYRRTGNLVPYPPGYRKGGKRTRRNKKSTRKNKKSTRRR